MKALLRALAFVLALGLAPAASVMAQDKPAATVEVVKLAANEATPAAAAASAPAAAAADVKAPVPNKGDTAWMTVATLLVIMMTVPGLALFYGGLVRAKNMLSVLMQVFVIFSMITVLWAIYGYSLAFGGSGAFFGNLSKLFLAGVNAESVAATFSKGVVIPELSFIAFQATFAGITCALIVGAFAERVRFSAVLLFSILWFTFAYLPIATWFGIGMARMRSRMPRRLKQ